MDDLEDIIEGHVWLGSICIFGGIWHILVLILLKGILFALSSRLIPDKANLGFRFP